MIPLIVSGVFIAGLVWLEKLGKPKVWQDRKEEERFRKEQEKWADECVFWNIHA